MFHPMLGRWLQEDPIAFEGGDENLYRAYGDSPLNTVDPSGLAGKATVSVTANEKSGFLFAEVGKFDLPQIPDGLDVHSNVAITWRTYRGVGESRKPLSVGQYIVWLKGREVVDVLRSQIVKINLSPLHGGHLYGQDPIEGYPRIETEEEFTKYKQLSLDARCTSGILQFLVKTKGYEMHQAFDYHAPVIEPTAPTEFPRDMLHPSRRGQPAGPVRPNRLQRLNDQNAFFRQKARWSLDMPPFWENASKYDQAVLVTLKWEWPSGAPKPTIQQDIK